MKKTLVIAFIVSIVLLSMLVLAGKGEPKVCADDVKVCSDGSTVVREAPSCKFAECPVRCLGDIKACANGKIVRRIAPSCKFDNCGLN